MIAIALMLITATALFPHKLFILYDANDTDGLKVLGNICNQNKYTLIGISDEAAVKNVNVTLLENCTLIGTYFDTMFINVAVMTASVNSYITRYPKLDGICLWYGDQLQNITEAMYNLVKNTHGLQYAIASMPESPNFTLMPDLIINYDMYGLELPIPDPIPSWYSNAFLELITLEEAFDRMIPNITKLSPQFLYATAFDETLLPSYLDAFVSVVNSHIECDESCGTCRGEEANECLTCADHYSEGSNGTCVPDCKYWTPSGVCGATSIEAIMMVVLLLLALI